MFAAVGFAIGLLIPSQLMAEIPVQYTMRTCVTETLDDPSLAEIQAGDYCSCVIAEIEADLAGDPDKYVYKRTGSAWSEKRQKETEERGRLAMEGHKAYCEAVSAAPAQSEVTMPGEETTH
jgi:hypothetical protein